ncbi:hypothetical protein TRFO_00797 [Tritrichomonas foetus]|uniref:Uncharacterized protein n=1 Tax=Tritrichomonas foetus TaxID=1144522 RepID=A0A1J4L225_9EUKA|nr:hypothetical protein TRFO_00797 [Tritrichomonas foetus]|eukprot:OHT17561.1 hypothetical protein TRFO_00797 [Tritrichomonas foetus]
MTSQSIFNQGNEVRFVIKRISNKNVLRQTERDQLRINEKVRKNRICYSQMEKVLNIIYGGQVTKGKLLKMAHLIAKQRNLKIERIEKRNKSALICWYCENCPDLLAYQEPSLLIDYIRQHTNFLGNSTFHTILEQIQQINQENININKDNQKNENNRKNINDVTNTKIPQNYSFLSSTNKHCQISFSNKFPINTTCMNTNTNCVFMNLNRVCLPVSQYSVNSSCPINKTINMESKNRNKRGTKTSNETINMNFPVINVEKDPLTQFNLQQQQQNTLQPGNISNLQQINLNNHIKAINQIKISQIINQYQNPVDVSIHETNNRQNYQIPHHQMVNHNYNGNHIDNNPNSLNLENWTQSNQINEGQNDHEEIVNVNLLAEEFEKWDTQNTKAAHSNPM